MTPKQIVQAKYPMAYADRSIKVGNWHIFDEMFRSTPAITAGLFFRSAGAAWRHAAKKIATPSTRVSGK